VTDTLSESFSQLLEALVRRVVREEMRRAELEWRWRTTPQAAALLGISDAAVRQRVRRKQLPAYRLDGRVYFDARELDALIRAGRLQ
jgi:excisionase family DNA binding protein